jgi:alkylation response protein AidB-like acyl-CoA dehydrogenase
MMFDSTSLIPTEGLKRFRDNIRRVAEEKIAPQASVVDEEEFFNHEVESLLWDHGLLTLTFPERYGGYGKDRTVALCIAWRRLQKFVLPLPNCMVALSLKCFR